MTTLQTGMHYPIDLDTLPESWEKGYVGDFAVEIRPGFASGQHNKEGRGIPHIRPFNIDRRGTLDLTQIKSVAPDADAKRLHSGDVLFNNTNSPELIGKTSFVAAAGDWGFSNHMTRVVFPEAVSPKFAAYQLHYLWMRGYFLHNCVKHVNQASISSTTLARAVPFVKPPRGQQDNIVAEIEKQFSRLDEAVANLKRVKANLKRYKAAVEGKLTEDWRKQHPNVESASKLLERILAERRAKWSGKGKYKEPTAPDTSDLPSLPKGWMWVSLEQLSWDSSYGTSVKCSYENSGPMVLRIPNIESSKLDFEDLKFAPKSSEIEQDEELSIGDVLIIRTNGSRSLIGRCAVIRQPLPSRSTYASYLIRFRLVKQLEVIAWVSIIWDADFFRQWIEQRAATSAGQHNISMTVLATLPIPLSPLAEQGQIVAEVERRLSVIEELETTIEANLTRADRLRQSILSQAFSGRLLGRLSATIPHAIHTYAKR